MDGPEQVTANAQEILDESVCQEKPLRVRDGFEPPHLLPALPRGLMRNLLGAQYATATAVLDYNSLGVGHYNFAQVDNTMVAADGVAEGDVPLAVEI